MNRFRFSLLALFGFVAAVAVGCAALMNPTPTWRTIVAVGAQLYLLSSVLALIYGRRVRRAFWLGFALFGWWYYYLPSQSYPFELRELAILKLGPGLGEGTGEFMDIVRWTWGLFLAFVGGLIARYLYLRREQAKAAGSASDN